MADKSRSRGRNRRRRRRRRPSEKRDWADLPRDVLSLIFQKLGAIEVLWPAQAVCRPWRQLSLEPQVWRCIDMRFHADLFNMIDMEELARVAVDRSGGHVEEFYAEYFGSDELLHYIAERTTGLRCLVLISAYDVSDEGLSEFAGRCPLLEELQIINCSFSGEACGSVGRRLPELKRFILNGRWVELDRHGSDSDFGFDTEALEIANNMPQLQELQLIGNQITNEGLQAILNKCPLLESLDIRACLNVNVDASMRARLARIRNVRLPNDSTADYGFDTGMGEDGSFFGDYHSGISETDLSYGDMFGYGSDFSYDDYTVADYFEDDGDGGFPFFFL